MYIYDFVFLSKELNIYCKIAFLWAGQKCVGPLPHDSSFSHDPSRFSLEVLGRSFISHKKDQFTEVIILTRNNMLHSQWKYFKSPGGTRYKNTWLHNPINKKLHYITKTFLSPPSSISVFLKNPLLLFLPHKHL